MLLCEDISTRVPRESDGMTYETSVMEVEE